MCKKRSDAVCSPDRDRQALVPLDPDSAKPILPGSGSATLGFKTVNFSVGDPYHSIHMFLGPPGSASGSVSRLTYLLVTWSVESSPPCRRVEDSSV